MTWTITGDMESCRVEKNTVDIGDMLCKCLGQARDRVTFGVMECAKLLRCSPDNVMLCLLPEASGQHDVTLDIQHTLIEAFCWENEIKLLKVDSQEKLAKMLPMCQDENNNGDVASCQSSDVSCLLIEYPKGDLSGDEEKLLNHVTAVMNTDTFPKPVIELPV